MRLGISDRQVIHAFTSGRSRAGTGKLTTDGKRLDGHWMGGNNIASWRGGKIVFHDLGSKSAQIVQNAVRRAAAPNDVARDPTTGKERWVVVFVSHQGAGARSIGRTPSFLATREAARTKTARLIASEMQSDRLTMGGYLQRSDS